MIDYDTMTVGETPLSHNAEDIAAYVLPVNKELNMVFHFEIMNLDDGGVDGGAEAVSPLVHRDWKLVELKNIVEKWQKYKRETGYWNACVINCLYTRLVLISLTHVTMHSLFLENHDHARSVSRFGNDSPEWRAVSAKLLALLHMTQSGTLFVYQGEEIGMANFPRSWGLEEYRDVATHNFWKQCVRLFFSVFRVADIQPGNWRSARRLQDGQTSTCPISWLVFSGRRVITAARRCRSVVVPSDKYILNN